MEMLDDPHILRFKVDQVAQNSSESARQRSIGGLRLCFLSWLVGCRNGKWADILLGPPLGLTLLPQLFASGVRRREPRGMLCINELHVRGPHEAARSEGKVSLHRLSTTWVHHSRLN